MDKESGEEEGGVGIDTGGNDLNQISLRGFFGDLGHKGDWRPERRRVSVRTFWRAKCLSAPVISVTLAEVH